MRKEPLVEELRRIVREHPENRHPREAGPYFEEPLVGFASATDPLFERYREVVGPFHRSPQELFEEAFGPGTLPQGTVVCWILPVSRPTRQSNRKETLVPSARWAHTRHFGEKFNEELRRLLVAFLESSGHRAVAPVLIPNWKRVELPPSGIASTWSERHAAYAAGLGTFSLSDALITARGSAHRIGSVVTDLVLAPDSRPEGDYRSHCLHFQGEACGACIPRCPAGAITPEGHDKSRCAQYGYEAVQKVVGEAYGVAIAGCGLCQTGVPCESRRPSRGARAPGGPGEG
jgi:epoxyqueuosine reductase